MTDDEILNKILEEEGGYSNRASDRGGPTKYGITATTLGLWRRLGRQATRKEVQDLTPDEAKAIYRMKFIMPLSWITDPNLRAQAIDFGVNSGPGVAVMKIQSLLGVTVDGIVGPETLAAMTKANPKLVNNSLVASRIHLLSGIVDHDATQVANLHGWVRRAVSFFV